MAGPGGLDQLRVGQRPAERLCGQVAGSLNAGSGLRASLVAMGSELTEWNWQ